MRAKAVSLPGVAYRLTWIASQLRKTIGVWSFADLLKEIAPTAYDVIAPVVRSEGVYCMAVIEHLRELFPIDDWAIEMAALDDITSMGVPILMLGVDVVDEGPDAIGSPATAICLCFPCIEDVCEAAYEEFSCLGNIELLPEPVMVDAQNIEPLAGREWIEPWNWLSMLYKYAHNMTGYAILDTPPSQWYYSGMHREFKWNMDNIMELEALWAAANPVWNGINTLMQYVDDSPRWQLVLAGALARDEEALATICKEQDA